MRFHFQGQWTSAGVDIEFTGLDNPKCIYNHWNSVSISEISLLVYCSRSNTRNAVDNTMHLGTNTAANVSEVKHYHIFLVWRHFCWYSYLDCSITLHKQSACSVLHNKATNCTKCSTYILWIQLHDIIIHQSMWLRVRLETKACTHFCEGVLSDNNN